MSRFTRPLVAMGGFEPSAVELMRLTAFRMHRFDVAKWGDRGDSNPLAAWFTAKSPRHLDSATMVDGVGLEPTRFSV